MNKNSNNDYRTKGHKFLNKMKKCALNHINNKGDSLLWGIYMGLIGSFWDPEKVDRGLLEQVVGEGLTIEPQLSNVDFEKVRNLTFTENSHGYTESNKYQKMLSRLYDFVNSRYIQLYKHYKQGEPMSLRRVEKDELRAACDMVYRVHSYEFDNELNRDSNLYTLSQMQNIDDLIDVLARNPLVINYINECRIKNGNVAYPLYKLCKKVKAGFESLGIDLTDVSNDDVLSEDYLNDITRDILPNVIKELKNENKHLPTNDYTRLLEEEKKHLCEMMHNSTLNALYTARQKVKNTLNITNRNKLDYILAGKKRDLKQYRRANMEVRKLDEKLRMAKLRSDKQLLEIARLQNNRQFKNRFGNNGGHALDIIFDKHPITSNNVPKLVKKGNNLGQNYIS